MNIRVAESPADIAAVGDLWREYWESFGLPDDFQGFADEVAGLPGLYGAEGGVLLVAVSGEDPAGTIALRRLSPAAGEMKRLYVRPAFRGQGLAKRLLQAAIQHAIAVKYQWLYADTLPAMTEALSLYERVGFDRTEAYSSTPTPGAIYLKLRLISTIEDSPRS